MLIKSFGFLCAHVPEYVLAFFAKVIGRLLVALPSRRRRILLSNLDRAFPEWSRDRLLKVARASAACLVEMGLFSLTYPFLSKDHIRRLLHIPPETERKLNELRRSNQPVVFFIPHVALFELLVASPHFRPGGNRRFGAVYRPNSNPVIDSWILQARRQKGLPMFARNAALIEAKGHLRKNNWLGVLFDQNAGNSGTLSTFLGRIASLTPLPGLLAFGTKSRMFFALTERTGFFRATLRLKEIKGQRSETLTTEAHGILESHLRSSDQACGEWLWAHDRWKTHVHWKRCLRFQSKRQSLPTIKTFPRKTKFWIRLPNWLGDVIMTLPLLRVLRKARPDAELTLICQPQFRPLLELLQVSDAVKTLPAKSTFRYYVNVLQWRKQYPDFQILFTNSLRGDVESFLMGAPNRFGLQLPGKPRPFLTKTYKLEEETFDHLHAIHQTNLWEKMMNRFGLVEKVCDEPFKIKDCKRDAQKIGIIPGSSNNPVKRWSVRNWVALMSKLFLGLPDAKIYLYGTQEDIPVANAIASGVNPKKIVNMAGKTSLRKLTFELAGCGLVVGNDTGGMHLANAVGTPVAVLYGPTNPLSTGPFFNSPKVCIQPKGSSSAGGASMKSLSVEDVFHEIGEMLKVDFSLNEK